MTSRDLIEFWDAYERLSEQGKCDGAGGMEFKRVLAAWLLADCPEAEPFIVREANRGPDGLMMERH